MSAIFNPMSGKKPFEIRILPLPTAIPKSFINNGKKMLRYRIVPSSLLLAMLFMTPFTTGYSGPQAKKHKSAAPTHKPAAVKKAKSAADSTAHGFAIGLHILNAQGEQNGGEIKFGVDRAATNCVDPQLGESFLPPKPPTGLPDARFMNPRGKLDTCYDQGVNYDFRPYRSASQIDTFKVQFQISGDFPVTVVWEPVPAHYDGSVTLRVPLNGKVLTVDMKKETSAKITEETPSFFIVAARPKL